MNTQPKSTLRPLISQISLSALLCLSNNIFAAIGDTAAAIDACENNVTPAKNHTLPTEVGNIAIGCASLAANGSDKESKLVKGWAMAERNNPYNKISGKDYGSSAAIGFGAYAYSPFTLALGSHAKASASSATAIGPEALSSGNTSLAIGRQAAAIADFAQAIGNVAAATNKGTLAIGHSATATGFRSIAIGSANIKNVSTIDQDVKFQSEDNTQSSGEDAIAMGSGAQAAKDYTLALGAFSKALALDSMAIGKNAQAIADNAIAIGNGASATKTGGTALGMNARVLTENSIALGINSVTSSALGDAYLTKQPLSSVRGVVSIGTPEQLRRIQNVADGAQDSDAATVAQLKAATSSVINTGQLDNILSLAKDYTDRKISQVTTVSNQNPANISNDINKLNNGSAGMFQVNQNETTTAPQPSAPGSVAGGSGAVASGNHSTAIGNHAQARAENSVALGESSVATRNNSVSIGSVGHERQISNVAAGVADTDAVNVSQMNHALNKIGHNISHLNRKINDIEDNSNAAIASAIAMANLPQPMNAGDGGLTMGFGTHRGESGYAVGYSVASNKGSWVFKAAATGNTQGKFGAGAGVFIKLH